MYKYNPSQTFSAASTRPAPACGRLGYKVIVSMRNLNYIEQKSVITARPFPLDGKTNSYNALLEASVRILYGRIHGATQLCRCVMMLLPQYYFLLPLVFLAAVLALVEVLTLSAAFTAGLASGSMLTSSTVKMRVE